MCIRLIPTTNGLETDDKAMADSTVRKTPSTLSLDRLNAISMDAIAASVPLSIVFVIRTVDSFFSNGDNRQQRVRSAKAFAGLTVGSFVVRSLPQMFHAILARNPNRFTAQVWLINTISRLDEIIRAWRIA